MVILFSLIRILFYFVYVIIHVKIYTFTILFGLALPSSKFLVLLLTVCKRHRYKQENMYPAEAGLRYVVSPTDKMNGLQCDL